MVKMRTFVKINRILFFLSFFLPFILLPQCEASKESLKEQARLDSIRISDSINNSDHLVDSCALTSLSIQSKPQEVNSSKYTLEETFTAIHSLLKSPTKNSISGYGIFFGTMTDLSFFKENVMLWLFSLTFLLLFLGILTAFIKPAYNLNTILSLFCFISVMIFLIYLIGNGLESEDILWGFWINIFLGFINVIMTIYSQTLTVKIVKR
jgi:hypothetical protein